MPRVLQIWMIGFGTLGLVLSLCLWAVAGVISLRNPGLGFTMGYGRDRGVLLNLRADVDGSLCVQHFPKNLSTRHGLYLDVTRSTKAMTPIGSLLWPRSGSDPTCTRVYWHLAPPAILSIILLAGALVPVWLRRRHRRRNGLCMHCGYDLRGAISGRCSECGHMPSEARRKEPVAAPPG